MEGFSEKFYSEIDPERESKVKKKIQEKIRELMCEQFKDKKIIGKGKTAEVWVGSIPYLKKEIVIKTNYRDDVSVNRVGTEFVLQHKFIAAGGRGAMPISFAEDDDLAEQPGGKFKGGSALVMEAIRGKTLEQLMLSMGEENKKFSIDDVKRLEADIKQQIDIAHSVGIYHRDLHLRNVMVNEKGEACIIDFGDAVDATGTHDENEIYTSEVWRGGQMVNIKFRRDEQILQNLRAELIRQDLVESGRPENH